MTHSKPNGARRQLPTDLPSHQLEIRLDADPFWMSPLRAFVSDFAERAAFDVDAVTDLTLAVDEAHTALITVADDSEPVIGRFALSDDSISVSVELGPNRTDTARTLSTDSYGWRVMSTLTDELELVPDSSHSTLGIHLTMTRVPAGR